MSMSEEEVHLAMGRAEALTLFEMLSDFHDQSCLRIRSDAERLALVRLQGNLEKVLVEPFMPDYQAMVDEARSRLTAEFGSE